MEGFGETGATRPPRLRPGDRVAVCAPAGPVFESRVRAGLERLRERYRVDVDPGLFSRWGYLAGGDEARAEALMRALRDPDVRAIFVARGGYGIMRILELLDAGALRRDPVPIVGFSDATALLAWARAEAGVLGVHGPVVTQLGSLAEHEIAWLYRLLEDPEPPGPLPWALRPLGAPLAEEVRGPLLGGNLCLLSHLAGTRYEVDLRGGVLFIEEIGERPYRIDRYLTHLWLARALTGVRAVVAGDFHGCEEPPDAPDGLEIPDAESVVDERLRAFSLSGLAGAPLGHGARNAALPFGAPCAADPAGGLALEASAVA